MTSINIQLAVGLDPSFRRAGLAAAFRPADPDYSGAGVLHLHSNGVEPGGSSFGETYLAAAKQCVWYRDALRAILDKHKVSPNDVVIYMECPPPAGIYAAGLYCLDTLLFYTLRKEKYRIVVPIMPNKIPSLMGARKVPKGQIVALSTEFQVLNSNDLFFRGKHYPKGYHVPRHNHDEASAFLLMALAIRVETGWPWSYPSWIPFGKWVLSGKTSLRDQRR